MAKSRTTKQLKLRGTSGWGGKRVGSGRPNLSGQVNHMKRPDVNMNKPLNITLRLKAGIPSLRNNELFKEFKKSVKSAKSFGLYVIHFSVQRNHIHLFAEAESKRALSSGMRALAGRFAKTVRKFACTKASVSPGGSLDVRPNGSVFEGRYHMRILTSPTEVRNALEYVTLNLSKHQKRIEYTDHYSSGAAFQDWKRLLGKRFASLIKSDAEFFKTNGPPKDLQEILSRPRSWLARVGWMKAC